MGRSRHHGTEMRLAIVSDIHGNMTAFEAVLADLRETSPDVILHGGDLPHGGSEPGAVVDRVRELGWPGVAGNTDELLWRPESLDEFAAAVPGVRPLVPAIREMGVATANALGEERLAWLRGLPLRQDCGPVALVHAAPDSLWSSPGSESTDAELEAAYSPLEKPFAVYAHIHTPYIRSMEGKVVANTGSVSLSYDGDTRASYLLIDDDTVQIRRVEYDIEAEATALLATGFPHAEWTVRVLRSARPQMP